ncbi:MAG: hypothetical protein AAGG72_05070 [Pseudomonadota bacterium]
MGADKVHVDEARPSIVPRAARPLRRQPRCTVTQSLALVVCATALLTHATLETRAQNTSPSAVPTAAPPRSTAPTEVPAAVLDMRQLILEAVASGRIEDLRLAIEWNELRPEFAIERDVDPITHFRRASADKEGHELLGHLARLLSGPPARLPVGRDLENNLLYVWPRIAEADFKQLTASERVELFRLMPAPEALAIIKTGVWTWYRLAIGADGTWHALVKAAQTGPASGNSLDQN